MSGSEGKDISFLQLVFFFNEKEEKEKKKKMGTRIIS